MLVYVIMLPLRTETVECRRCELREMVFSSSRSLWKGISDFFSEFCLFFDFIEPFTVYKNTM